jgi:hypothetical protein
MFLTIFNFIHLIVTFFTVTGAGFADALALGLGLGLTSAASGVLETDNLIVGAL